MSVFVALPGNEPLARTLARETGGRYVELETRNFPDGESYVRILGEVKDELVRVVCTLAEPDPRFLRLVFVAGAARDGGAKRVELIAPYLAYMRQDRRFADGEAVSARHFAKLVSTVFDGLVTVDPHLHRIHDLSEVFSIPARTLHAAPLLAEWIQRNVPHPVVIGPDSESLQWVEAVATSAGAPYAVLAKLRRSDREVEISLPDLSFARGRQPVLVDDIISSGRTLMQTAAKLADDGFVPPVCVAVHGLFAEDAYQVLKSVAAMVVTTDTVPHASNAIAIAPLVRQALMLH